MKVRSPAVAWKAPPLGTGKLIALERDEFLAIRNGPGLRVRALSGILWITEAGSSADRVLRPGDEIDLACAGTAIASAARAARLVVETVAGRARPDAIEKVQADGRRILIVLGAKTPGMASTWAGAIATAIGDAFAALRTLGAPRTCPDAYLPQQRRTQRATRGVERAIIDQWLMWRK